MAILPQIKHIIVVMLENRSFDNICGWLYKPGTTPPAQPVPAGLQAAAIDGLKSTYFNPVNQLYFTGQSTETYPVFDQANATTMPDPDPEEDFGDVSYQLFGPEAPSPTPNWPNLGFVINYAKVTGTNIPVQIMEPFSPSPAPRHLRAWPPTTPSPMPGFHPFPPTPGPTAPSSTPAPRTGTW